MRARRRHPGDQRRQRLGERPARPHFPLALPRPSLFSSSWRLLGPARWTGWSWQTRFSGLPGSRRYSVLKFNSDRDISIARDDTDYALNYLSISDAHSRSAQASGNAGVDMFGAITRSFGISGSTTDAHSEVKQSIQYSKRNDFAAKWLSSAQLKTYAECIRAKTRGLSAIAKNWTEDSATFLIKYVPEVGQPPKIQLRKMTRILSGVPSPKEQIKKFPEMLSYNEERVVTIPRVVGKALQLQIDYPSAAIDIELPIVTKLPCVRRDEDTGNCISFIQFLKFEAGPRTARSVDHPVVPRWDWSSAVISISGNAKQASNSPGAAGLMTFGGTTESSNGTLALFEARDTLLKFNPAPNNGAQPMHFAWRVPRDDRNQLVSGVRINECRAYFNDQLAPGPPSESSTCSVSVVVMTRLLK